MNAPAIKIKASIPLGASDVTIDVRQGARRVERPQPGAHQEPAPEVIPEARRIEARPPEPKALTFREAAEAYVATHRGSWKNAKHAEQWTGTLEKWVYPLFGDRPVADIDVPAVFKVIETPVGEEGTFWAARPETARRTLNRIESVLDWAKVRGHRTAENPARWRGNLDKALPVKGRSKNHHAALPFAEVRSPWPQ